MIFPQEVIGEGLSSEDLINFLQENYTTNSVLSYNAARDAMYGQIYNDNGNLSCVYTQYTINNVPTSKKHKFNNGEPLRLPVIKIPPETVYKAKSKTIKGINSLK